MERYGLREDSRHRMVNEDMAARQLKRFGWSMVTLGASIGLYYLGFFDTLEGPLNPHKIGSAIAGLGVTESHVIVMLISLFLISVSWNWVYNWIVRQKGADEKGSADPPGNMHLPVKKGPWGHTAWVAVLMILVGIVMKLY